MADQRNDRQKEAMAQIQAVYEDGFAEINGREYHFCRMRHQQRTRVFAFFSSIGADVSGGNFMFLDSPMFREVEKLIMGSVTFGGNLLSKLPEHWEDYPEDYVTFVVTALGVVSYPFLQGSSTGSPSQPAPPLKTTSKKPM